MPAEFDWQAYEAELADLAGLAASVPVPANPDPPPPAADPTPPTTDTPADRLPVPVDGAALLDELHAALCRYLVMPSVEAADAVVLWIAATHGQPAWEHATRLVVTGPAKQCGKSRLLEIVKETCHNPLPTVNTSTPAIYRSIDTTEPPTILLDEADTVFGTRRAAEANDDLRGLLNAGHSRGWPVRRCAGPNNEVREFASFAMAALAGIGEMPETITDRAVNIRMRRRAPTEQAVPYRIARDGPPLRGLRARLYRWVRAHLDELRAATPALPVEDRPADTWESLIAIADLAGGSWPDRARRACVTLVNAAAEADTDNSDSLRLLADLRTIYGTADKLYTSTILQWLRAIEDSPWAELTAHHLAKTLRPFGIRSRDVREDGTGTNLKGYDRADLTDAFTRYLKPAETINVADTTATETETATALTSHVADVADSPPQGNRDTDDGDTHSPDPPPADPPQPDR